MSDLFQSREAERRRADEAALAWAVGVLWVVAVVVVAVAVG